MVKSTLPWVSLMSILPNKVGLYYISLINLMQNVEKVCRAYIMPATIAK
jgi:hypothetical protein